MKPVISIIVPVYNIAPYLKKCLDSILAQTLTNFEVIVVNDGSTDGSNEICDEYRDRDKRVKVIHQKYGGVSSARNAGVSSAEGEFIGFVDGDDYIDPNMYQILYQLCTDTGSDISICTLGREINGIVKQHDPVEIVTQQLTNEAAMRELFKGTLYRFSLCNKLFRRSCFDGIQFPEGRIHEDLATTYRLIANANQVMYTNYTGYIYVKRKNSILTSTYAAKRLDALVGWDEILPFIYRVYPQLVNEVNACFVYICTDHVYAILEQVGDRQAKKEYLNRVRQMVKKHYKRIRNTKALSFTYKCIITSINYNINLLVAVHRLKHIRSVKQ